MFNYSPFSKKKTVHFLVPLLISLLFFLLAGSLYILGQMASADSYYKGGRVYEPSQQNYDEVAVAVYDIAPVQAKAKGSDSKLYLISHDRGKILLEAPVKDSQIEELLADTSSLKNSPAYLKVRVVSGQEVGDAYSDKANDLNSSSEGRRVASNDYLSLSAVRHEELIRTVGVMALTIAGAVLLAYVIWQTLLLYKRRQALFAAYPELEGSLEKLEQADYKAEDLGLVLYRHHLISFAKGFHVVDLRQVVQLQTLIVKPVKTISASSDALIEITLRDGSTRRMPVKKSRQEIEMRLEDLYDRIEAQRQVD